MLGRTHVQTRLIATIWVIMSLLEILPCMIQLGLSRLTAAL